MNIILEGPDNSGKSTLALALNDALGWPIKRKEGRPLTRLALLEKLRKYEAIDHHIIDRHPIVSQTVYGLVRNDLPIPDEFMDRFFEKKAVIVYCRCISKGLEGHEPSPTDTPAHLKMIEEQQEQILHYYDNWASLSANIIYHKYDDMEVVVEMVKAAVAWEAQS